MENPVNDQSSSYPFGGQPSCLSTTLSVHTDSQSSDIGDIDSHYAHRHLDLENILALAFLADQADMGESSSRFSASLYPKKNHFSVPRRRRRKKDITEKVSIDSFDSEQEKHAFIILKDIIATLFNTKATQSERLHAFTFIFKRPTSIDEDKITFTLCCQVLQTRPEVLLARIQYEFWLKNIIFTDPIPLDLSMIYPIPYNIINKMAYVNPTNLTLSKTVCDFVWAYPSISMTHLLELIDSPLNHNYIIAKVIQPLLDSFILSAHADNLYLTSFNPLLRNLLSENALGFVRGYETNWSSFFS